MTFVAIILKLVMWVFNIFLYVCVLALLYWLLSHLLPSFGWKKWKTLEEYWAAHPECKTQDGTKCFNCGSRHIRQYGYESNQDIRRVHQCNQCNTGLYRT